jgi:hypothetical protein
MLRGSHRSYNKKKNKQLNIINLTVVLSMKQRGILVMVLDRTFNEIRRITR